MKPRTVGELALLTGGRLEGVSPDVSFTGFALDNRQVRSGDLFLAIRGARVDGHDYAVAAIEAGAAAVLAERSVGVPSVVVPNLVQALASYARHFRDQMEIPVIGVTGSMGKTTTKEFLASALAPLGAVGKTTGNRNTEYTLPLLWPELDGGEVCVVAEMGMRGFGHIAHLASFCRPTIGVITVIGHAHLEMVGSRSGIARAKGELLESLPADGLAVCWAEDEFLHELRSYAADREWATYGEAEGADARLVGYEAVGWGRSRARYVVDGVSVSAELPVVGRHMARNAAAALLVAARLGADLGEAAAALSATELPAMRMQAVEWRGATILVDTYNAAPGSFSAALETARENSGDGRLWVVMGEMKELGELTEASHAEVGRAIAASEPFRVGFLGEQTRYARAACVEAGLPEADLVELQDLDAVAAFLSDLAPGDVALVKGSRAMELEKALAALGVPL